MDINIRQLGTEEERAWDSFVHSHVDGTFFHLRGWSGVIEDCFGYRGFHLAAYKGEEIVGVLPLVQCRSLLAGHSLVSVPFGIRGGLLTNNVHTAAKLLEAAIVLAKRLRVDYLELRSERSCSTELLTKHLYVTFKADLSLAEADLLERMERKRRQMLNHAARVGYTFRVAGEAELSAFYELFARSMRSHGTPVHSHRFLLEILRRYPEQANLGLVYKDDQLLAGTLNLSWGATFMPFYAGVDRERRLRAVDEFMYWSLMRWAKTQGFRVFDFGRSRKATGAYKFKARWGMEELPLAYQYFMVNADKMPNLSPNNPRYETMIRTWRRLPLPLTRFLGPTIAKRIP